ncbi:MAG: proline iminopeptidase-family hydrolase [Chitinophagaceae bacterium]|nr:proline iminopeptidase-family hydrolase [Chitinophagaceae bacterium]
MKNIAAFIGCCMVCFACNQPTTQSNSANSTATQVSGVKTGGTRLIQVDGKYNVWTKKVGDGKIKVLLLHGGPGFTHDYMECFEDFLPKEGIEFYYYDQLGCGNSDIPTDTSLWRIPRFVEEVEQVRKGLGLDNFYLLGHSWGGMLAMEYLHKYQSHVKGAVLSNMTAGISSYMVYAQQLKQKFFSPADIKKYDSLDQLKKYESPEFQDLLMNKLYSKVICRLNPWPEPILRAFKKANMNIYIQMQGVDEFHVTGNFKNWDMWDRLKDITVPALVLGGQNDEMNPADMKREAALLPNSRLYLCPDGSHMAMYDDQQNYFRELIRFLKDVDNSTFKADKKQ